MDSDRQSPATLDVLVQECVAAECGLRIAALIGGPADLRSQWARHVEQAETRLFPRLVASSPAADGPVGFCLAEHAALGACLAQLEASRFTAEWCREAERLVGRMIHHLFLEARILQPLLGQAVCGDARGRADLHLQGRGTS